MALPYELDEAPVDAYLGADLRVAELPPLDATVGSIEAEGTDLALGLAVVQRGQVVAERQLSLAVRFRLDNVAHLWHDRGDAISATVTIDPTARRLGIQLTFAPAGHSAAKALKAAEFLRQASAEGAQLALRLPDGTLGPERLSLPPDLAIDDTLIRLLRLVTEVGRLSKQDIPVPKEIDADVIRDLLTAQHLLSGQSVRKRWQNSEVRLTAAALDSFREAMRESTRHEVLFVGEMHLDFGEVRVSLGEIHQQFSDAVVDDVTEDGEEVVLRLRAFNGSAPMEMRPSLLGPPPIDAHTTIPDAAFDELLEDLDAPARPSKLRELM
jgi:hypothetical protein